MSIAEEGSLGHEGKMKFERVQRSQEEEDDDSNKEKVWCGCPLFGRELIVEGKRR